MSPRSAAISVVMFAAGCSATITPPRAPANPVTVYVADYGRHSSLILPNPATGGWTEYAWADWDWFANGDAHWYMIPHAMLFSDQATLGERNIGPESSEEALRKKLEADSLLSIRCSADLVEALRQDLNERFSARSVTLKHSNYSKMEHVKDDSDGHYWFMHNCNHATAHWLEELGCHVKGEPTLSHFKLETAPTSKPSP